MVNFSFHRRNPFHWDVAAYTGEAGSLERAFRIRGGPHELQWGGDGSFRVFDERESTRGLARPVDDTKFPDLASAVAWITATLMAEPSPTPPMDGGE